MNHKHRKVLHALFAHPVSANISARAVEAVFGELGADMESRHNGRLAVKLNDKFMELAHPQGDLSPEQVRQVKHFLSDAGIDPERDYPL